MGSLRIRLKSFAATLLTLVGMLALTAIPAQAQVFLDMRVDPATLVANAGTTPQWDIILTNNTGGDATITLTGFAPGFPLTPDVDISTGILPSGTIFLADGQDFVLSSFITTAIHANASSAVYDALAEMTYDATDANGDDFFDLTTVADYQLTVVAQPVAANAPEPASIVLLLSGFAFIRRGRNRK